MLAKIENPSICLAPLVLAGYSSCRVVSIAGRDGLVRGRHASGGQPTVVCLYMDAEWAQHLAAGSAALGARQFFVSSSSDHQPHINPSESAAGCTSSLLSFTTTTPAAFSLSLATRYHVLQENRRCRCPGGRSPNGWLICAIVSSVPRMRCQILARFPRLMASALPFLTTHRLSTQCQAALATIVGNSDASCLNAQALIGLVVSTSSTTNTSIIPTVNTWLTGMCSRPACTNATLATVVSSVTSGCSTELGQLGLSDVDSSSLTALVQSAYPTVRQVACLGE